MMKRLKKIYSTGVESILESILCIKKKILLIIVWVFVYIIYINYMVGFVKENFSYSISAMFPGVLYKSNIYAIMWLYIHVPIWCIVYKNIVEYLEFFYVYVYMKKGSILKIVINIILSSIIISAIYYLIVYLMTYIFVVMDPLGNLKLLDKGITLVKINVFMYFIEQVMTAFCVEMIMFIVYLILKNREKGIIIGLSVCLLINYSGIIFGKWGGLLLLTTDNVALRNINTSQHIYTFMSIVYALIIMIIVRKLLVKKSESIVTRQYYT